MPHCNRMPDSRPQRPREGQQTFIELGNYQPLNTPRHPPLRMHRLNRRLDLKPPRSAHLSRRLQDPLSPVNHRVIPQRNHLLVQWHIAACRIHPRRPPGMTVQHQRKQSQGFRLPRHQRHRQITQSDGLNRHLASRLTLKRRLPTTRKRRINRIQHKTESLVPLLSFRHLKRYPRRLDLGLHSHQSLSNRHR